MTALNVRVEVARKTREEGGDSVKRWLAHTMNLLILKVITAFPSLVKNFELHLGDESSNLYKYPILHSSLHYLLRARNS